MFVCVRAFVHVLVSVFVHVSVRVSEGFPLRGGGHGYEQTGTQAFEDGREREKGRGGEWTRWREGMEDRRGEERGGREGSRGERQYQLGSHTALTFRREKDSAPVACDVLLSAALLTRAE